MNNRWHYILFLILSLSQAIPTDAYSSDPTPEGAWRYVARNSDGDIAHILLFSGAYFSHTRHSAESGAFISTWGGSWRMDGDQLVIEYEFDTRENPAVGKVEKHKVVLSDNELVLEADNGPVVWNAFDGDLQSPLFGPWLFSGRENNGEISRRDTNQPRKTMKIMTGSRFQWIAYNTETGEFFGTGGGSYTARDGVYTELIEFFSRDNARVGAELRFEYRVEGDDWHHRGKSSAGDPMYEIWTRRK